MQVYDVIQICTYLYFLCLIYMLSCRDVLFTCILLYDIVYNLLLISRFNYRDDYAG